MDQQSARVGHSVHEHSQTGHEFVRERPVRRDRWGGWRLPRSPLDSSMTCHLCWGISTFTVVFLLLELFA
jgi:hypothetical protein